MTTDPHSSQSQPESNKSSQRARVRESQEESPRERQAMLRLASAGFEIASFSLILGAAGYGIDHAIGNASPYAAIAGLLLGFTLGFYRLIVLANKLS